MKPITTFGIGCFHLSMKLEPPYRLRPLQYAETLETLLSDLDTVGSFSVSPSTLASSEDLTLTEHALSILYEAGWLPDCIDTVEFSLRIPQRVQRNIIEAIDGRDYSWSGLGTEHFMVRTQYFYYGPVTIVECLDVDDSQHDDASQAVVVVREYLKRKLAEAETDIQIEVVGPSPFHADFCVFENEGKGTHVEYEEKRGYDRIRLHLPSYVSERHTEWILNWMGDLLSFYYHLIRLDNWQMKQWAKVDKAWHSLNDPSGSGTWSKRVGVSIGRRRAIGNLVDRVLMFRAEVLWSQQVAYSAKKGLQTDEGPDFLDRKVDDAFEETFRGYPTSEVLELAKFYETRDAKWRDRAYVLLAAVMGGGIGALLSQLWPDS